MFSTKAKNLNFLKDKLSKSIVGDQISFSLNDWNKNKKQKLKDLKIFFKKKKVIIRSSSKLEDRSNASLAGHFLSIQNVDVNNTSLLSLKIDKVWNSLKHKKNLLDKIFIQEYISDVILSGVIFTRGINNNSNYYFINFDEKNNFTNNITSGKINGKTVIINRVIKRKFIEIFFINILRSVQEIENILKFYNLDIEFAIDKEKQIHIFQYRKLNNINRFKFDLNVFNKNLNKNIRRFLNYKKLDKTNITNNFLSNMSDWNPAEMIGILPKDFAYDLYSKLITNKMWYLQRKEFGGSKLSDHKLMKKILGRPYVDIGLSLKSFIPNNLNKKLKNKLVVTYLEYLSKKKYLHDKIEFEVAFTSWTPDLPTLLKKRFGKNIFSKSEIENISASLKKITSSYILNNQKYLKQSNELLIKRNKIINDKNKSEIEKVIILINDCKRYGILPFAHAARMSFISKSILNYFLRKKILSEQRYNNFLNSISTVSTKFNNDKQLFINKKISKKYLLEKYGHLRENTYEISNYSYAEKANKYLFDREYNINKKNSFKFNKIERNKINIFARQLLNTDYYYLKDFLIKSIQAREELKFEFTKNINASFSYLIKWAKKKKIKRQDLSYLLISDLKKIESGFINKKTLISKLNERKNEFERNKFYYIPDILTNVKDFYYVEHTEIEPNFITNKNLTCNYVEITNNTSIKINNKIILIEYADPGYDWIFTKKIKGLITKYGGANSHMAIRCAEHDIPAAIGVGEKIYNNIKKNKIVTLNCENKNIKFNL